MAPSDPDAADLHALKEERLSTEKCLQICSQLSDHISQIQLISDRVGPPRPPHDADASPEGVTHQGLQECKTSLASTAAKLEKHMQDIMDRLISKSKTALAAEEDTQDLTRLRDEWETARQCWNICSTADHRLNENVSVIENYGTGDALQFMVSTDGKILHGKNRAAGWRSRQVGGHMSNETAQQISRDIVSINMAHVRANGPGREVETPPSREEERRERDEQTTTAFRGRYGHGFKLEAETSSGGTPSSPAPDSGRR